MPSSLDNFAKRTLLETVFGCHYGGYSDATNGINAIKEQNLVKKSVFLHILEYKWRSLEILARRLWDSLNGIIMTQGQWFLQVDSNRFWWS